MTDAATGAAPPGPFRRISNQLGYAVFASLAVNLAIYGIARLADVDFLVPATGDDTEELAQVGPGAVVVSTFLALGVGTVVALLLGRWAPRARLVFTVAVFVALVLSFGLLLDPDISGETKFSLAIMHPVVAAAALQWLRPLTEPAGPTAAAADDADGPDDDAVGDGDGEPDDA